MAQCTKCNSYLFRWRKFTENKVLHSYLCESFAEMKSKAFSSGWLKMGFIGGWYGCWEIIAWTSGLFHICEHLAWKLRLGSRWRVRIVIIKPWSPRSFHPSSKVSGSDHTVFRLTLFPVCFRVASWAEFLFVVITGQRHAQQLLVPDSAVEEHRLGRRCRR